MTDRDLLRAGCRARRASIEPERRQRLADAVTAVLLDHPGVTRAERVALYRATGEELDPAEAAVRIRDRGGSTWYPAVVDGALEFRAWNGEGTLSTGHFGVEIPPPGPALDPLQLDVVLLPLVGFDRAGNRLGMGAGYYDRTFAARRGAASGPMLVGLAFDEQELDAIAPEPWDVRLDAVATPSGWIDCG